MNECVYYKQGFKQLDSCGLKVAGFKFQVSSFKFQVSGFRFQVSGFRFQVSGFRFQMTGFQLETIIFIKYVFEHGKKNEPTLRFPHDEILILFQSIHIF